MADELPSFRLLSILFSAVPLEPSLSLALLQAARELVRDGLGAKEILGDALRGRVTDLRREALLGTLGGPLFEAQVDTARGSGLVRFLVTREGLEEDGAPPPPRRRGRELLN